jgi:hypothetical protein
MKFRIILGLTLACFSAGPAWAGQRVTAAIMFSGGDNTGVGATANYAAIVEVSTKNMRRFITQGQFSGGLRCIAADLFGWDYSPDNRGYARCGLGPRTCKVFCT